MTRSHSHLRARRPPTRPRRRRALAGVLATAALPLASLLAVVALAATGSDDAATHTAATIRAAGAVTMTNTKAPGAILTATGMRPGASVQGTVTITNTGDPAAYVLAASKLTDTPGPLGGSALSARLQLLVEDVTGATPVAKYAGSFGAMPTEALGSYASGEARTYRFTVTLPDGGAPPSDTAGDNLYQGASSSIEFDWTATGGSTGGGPTGGSGGWPGSAGGTSGGTGGGGAGGGVGHRPTGSLLKLKYAKKQKAKKGIAISATCLVNCTATFSGKVNTCNAGKSYSLTKVTKSLRAGKAATIKLKLSSKTRKAVQKALVRHKRVRATLQVTVRGSSASSRRITISLTK